MQETREVASAAELEVPPTAPDHRSKKITAGLIGLGIVGVAALGLLHDAGSDRTVAPTRLTQSTDTSRPDANGAAIVPFPVPPATTDGVSSEDG